MQSAVRESFKANDNDVDDAQDDDDDGGLGSKSDALLGNQGLAALTDHKCIQRQQCFLLQKMTLS